MCLLVHVEYLWKITGCGGEGEPRIEKGTKGGEGLFTEHLSALFQILPCPCYVMTVLFLNDNLCLLQIENPFYSLTKLYRYYLSELFCFYSTGIYSL